MLAYFPTPYPDELLFSVLSRLADAMQYPHKSDLTQAVYDQEEVGIAVNLASHLEALLAALPPGHGLSAEKIIQEQTLFPFYQPFLAAERVRKLKEAMCQPNLNQVYGRMGLSRWRVPEPTWLRFCYDCLVADRKQYGQGYWHRLHQVPGVKVCPRHGAMLQDSRVSIYYRPPTQHYMPAERALERAGPVPNPFPPGMQAALLHIARDADWLLQHNYDHITPPSLQARFRLVLAEQRLITYLGRPHATEFLNVFQAHHAPELLSLLDCPLDSDDSRAWPVITIRPETTQAKHPLQQMLVIQALGYSVESFFALPTQVPYFGEKPWPCLNPASDHFRRPVIESYHLDYQKLGIRPRATFACPVCGFTYRRDGPDTSPEDRYRTGRILSYGPVWEARLQQLRADPTMTYVEIARQLHSDPSTVATYVMGQRASQPDREVKRAAYRAIWLEALERLPEAQVGELNRAPEFSPAYHWLLRHDREWYKAHTRDGRKCPRWSQDRLKRSRVNSSRERHTWDVRLAEEVRLAAGELLRRPGKPEKITGLGIFRHLNRSVPHAKEFPVTRRTLKAVTEPHEAFVMRRMAWATHQQRQPGMRTNRKELIVYSGVSSFFYQPRWKALGQKILEKLASPGVDAGALMGDLLPSAQQDWPALDAELAERVVQAAERLKQQPDYPTRVTMSTIGIDLDRLEVLLQHLEKLPHTAHILPGVVETDAAFATRVVEWIVAHDPDASGCDQHIQFVRLTGLRPYVHVPAVAQIIDAAFDRLQAQNELVKTEGNWAARDRLLAPAVRKAAEALSQQPDIRVTRRTISQWIDASNLLDGPIYDWLLYHLRQLPQTEQVLISVMETPEQFVQRRWYQLAEQFRRQGIRPSVKDLRGQVGNGLFESSPTLRHALNQILASLADLPLIHEVQRQEQRAEFDAQLAPLIGLAAEHLKAQTDPFARVTKAAIGDCLGQYRRLMEQLENLPRTAEALAEVVESSEEFALRHIRWWGAYYRDRQVCPRRRPFIEEAGVRKMIHRPAIQSAVSEALQSLSSFPSKQGGGKAAGLELAYVAPVYMFICHFPLAGEGEICLECTSLFFASSLSRKVLGRTAIPILGCLWKETPHCGVYSPIVWRISGGFLAKVRRPCHFQCQNGNCIQCTSLFCGTNPAGPP